MRWRTFILARLYLWPISVIFTALPALAPVQQAIRLHLAWSELSVQLHSLTLLRAHRGAAYSSPLFITDIKKPFSYLSLKITHELKKRLHTLWDVSVTSERHCLGKCPNWISWIQLEKAQASNEHFITQKTLLWFDKAVLTGAWGANIKSLFTDFNMIRDNDTPCVPSCDKAVVASAVRCVVGQFSGSS